MTPSPPLGHCLSMHPFSKPYSYSNPAAQVEGAHPVGAMAVAWSPAAPPGSLVSAKGPGRPERRFASAGCDNTVKVRPR